ncbi:MAG: aminotransferase class I/II-fold pyridoxal phosphate-dependent enzyme [Pseudoflavonifractor sp.]
MRNGPVFTKDFTKQEPIPEAGIKRAVEILQTGRIHRYNVAKGEISEAAQLECEYASYMGTKYCVGISSCGSSIYVALKSVGIKPGDKVLCNSFTLAPVPGAMENAGAKPVFVEITDDLTTDLDDLERKAATSGAKYFLLSHMRGHIVNMDRVAEICKKYSITLVEDCAHTTGAKWGDRLTGTFGDVGCFSTQTYKHMNSGEGGLLVTNRDDVCAKAILYSGSYMLYDSHLSRPDEAVFQQFKGVIPNYSLRMSNLVAALVRCQLPNLDVQCRRWNDRHDLLKKRLSELPQLHVPFRPEAEHYVGSSFQFLIPGASAPQMERFIAACAERGVEVKWFGAKNAVGFTSSWENWEYIDEKQSLPQTRRVLNVLCDFRVPLTFTLDDCEVIAAVIRDVTNEVFG